MMVPTLYVCQQVEESRRRDERRDAELWRMLRGKSRCGQARKALDKRPFAGVRWVRALLGSPGL
jgi:hypothetical protein